MSNWNMPPGVSTNDIPGQSDSPTDDEIQTIADDIRLALINLRNNPDDDDCFRDVQIAIAAADMMAADIAEDA